LTLLWTLERGFGDVDGIEEAFRPGFWLRRFKHNGIAVLADEDSRRQVNALRQADGLAVAFDGYNCCFHASEVLANNHTWGAISENLWWVGYWTW
jgi:hypothetical protein